MRTILEKKNSFFIWVIFLIWPFLSFLISIRSYRAPWSKNILWAFITFFGFTFAVSVNNISADVNRYIERFRVMRDFNMTFTEFWDLLYVNEDFADVLQPLITLIVSKFTGNPFILIAVFGFVFGYFYSRNIYYLIKMFNLKNNRKIFFLMIVFSMVVPFWSINGFRFWTATHIFFYGAIRYIYEKKNYGLLIACLSLFCHFSFFLPPAVLLIYSFSKTSCKIYFYLFVFSMFVSELSIDSVKNSISSTLPDIFVERTEGYLDENRVENYRNKTEDSRAFYAIIYMNTLMWVIVAFLVFIYIKGKKLFTDDVLFKKLFAFTLLLYSISNIMNLLPSGGRFVTVSNLFAMAVIIKFINSNIEDIRFTKLYRTSVPFFSFYLLINLWVGFAYIGLFSIIGNPVTAAFGTNNISLVDIIK